MEEAELVRERLQAITDKRKIQEEISQKRLKIEEEKLTHQHLKKKALREKWLLDGTGGGKEQEEMKRRSQQDQRQMQALEQSIHRLEKEIQDLETAELQISTNEAVILKKLKSVERTTEDIIRSVKVEKEETSGESIEDIYANIPDLPTSYVPSRLRKERNDGTEDDEHGRKALCAVEIRVEKDPSTGESTVLSSIPLPSGEFTGPGVKVYDDGQKSVFAVSPGRRAALNGTAGLAPGEVDDLLRQASERSSRCPTEYHEPVYANPFCRPPAPQREQAAPGLSFHGRIETKVNGLGSAGAEPGRPVGNGDAEDGGHGCDHAGPARPVPRPRSAGQRAEEAAHTPPRALATPREDGDGIGDKSTPSPRARPSPGGALAGPSDPSGAPSPAWRLDEEDVRYNIVHSLPSDVGDGQPVTMIFMGYQQAEDDEEEQRLLTGYDGIIHAELVVIDEEEDGEREAEKPSPQPAAPQPARPTPLPRRRTDGSPHGSPPRRHSASLREQGENLRRHPPHRGGPVAGDGTEDPSLTALRMRMAKLGKKVI